LESSRPVPKFLGVSVLALAVFSGVAFAGRSDMTPSGATTAPKSIGGDSEVHYAPGEDLESIDVALIGEARKQIDMAACVLTDRAVIRALREAAGRGVKVRIWRDANMAAKVGDYDVEAQLGGQVQGVEIRSNAPGGELMHLKDLCGSPSVAHWLSQFQPVLRDTPGQ
jgi:phosphatidylserine/phosphatidylglycerophosphate/cardiolipin synthase-like enzyme